MSGKPPVEAPIKKPKFKFPGLPSNRTAMLWLTLALLVWLAANVIGGTPDRTSSPANSVTPMATARVTTPRTSVATRASTSVTPPTSAGTRTPTRLPTPASTRAQTK